MSVKIRKFKGKYTSKMLPYWKLTEEHGGFESAAEKSARRAVAFFLNECAKGDDEVDGMSIYMPAAYDDKRMPHAGIDAVRISIGLTGGDITEPYFEVTFSDLVADYIDMVEEGWKDGREELKKKLLKMVAAIEKSQKQSPPEK